MNMKAWWVAFIGGLAVLVLIAISIARMYGPPAPVPAEQPPPSTPTEQKETAHITATLFFGSSDGQALVPIRRDVPLASSVVEQGRQILTAQLTAEPPIPISSLATGAGCAPNPRGLRDADDRGSWSHQALRNYNSRQ